MLGAWKTVCQCFPHRTFSPHFPPMSTPHRSDSSLHRLRPAPAPAAGELAAGSVPCTRRTLLGALFGFGFSTLGMGAAAWVALREGAPTAPIPTAAGAVADADREAALAAWLAKPRLPEWRAAGDATADAILTSLERGRGMLVRYWGGTTPGETRRISPGLVFRLEEGGPLYVSAYCHERGATRTFRLGRLELLDGLEAAAPPSPGTA